MSLAAALRQWAAGLLRRHWNHLLALDLRAAHLLHAPAGFTLSGLAYRQEQRGSAIGHFWRRVIDAIFLDLLSEHEHCKQSYEADLARSTTPKP